jgi:predicted transcriptional regulator
MRTDDQDLAAEIREAERDMERGHYIRDEDMRAWLHSWGTEDELPLPKCVCGKHH